MKFPACTNLYFHVFCHAKSPTLASWIHWQCHVVPSVSCAVIGWNRLALNPVSNEKQAYLQQEILMLPLERNYFEYSISFFYIWTRKTTQNMCILTKINWITYVTVNYSEILRIFYFQRINDSICQIRLHGIRLHCNSPAVEIEIRFLMKNATKVQCCMAVFWCHCSRAKMQLVQNHCRG